jgi:hypothetical protein
VFAITTTGVATAAAVMMIAVIVGCRGMAVHPEYY